MLRTAAAMLVTVGMAQATWGAVFQVTNRKNSGAGSLRQAILDANAHVGPDRITFAPALSGQTISPSSPLPALTDDGTILRGDIDGDGDPDIQLDGGKLASGIGLRVKGTWFTEIIGLAITAFPDTGLQLHGARQAEVRSCYFGVSLPPSVARPNGEGAGATGEQVELLSTDHNWIGPSAVRGRNVFHCGTTTVGNVGLRLVGSQDNKIASNLFGLKPDGTSVWPGQNCAVRLEPAAGGRQSVQNGIGGEINTGEPNYFAGPRYDVSLHEARHNYIRGSYYGLALDRSTVLSNAKACVYLGAGSSDNRVGGGPTERNVFATTGTAVHISGPNAYRTEVQGNYFGTNGKGTGVRVLGIGVRIDPAAGVQYIGGDEPAYGNYFTPNGTTEPTGVQLDNSGAGVRIENNHFGVLPSSSLAKMATRAIYCVGASPVVRANRIARAQKGIDVWGAASNPQVYLNEFSHCGTAVRLNDQARCRLGNLGNTSTADDGGNSFASIANWFVFNATPSFTKAEGNDFGTTSAAAIEAKIHDKRDNPARGRVDFRPLAGGIMPTGDRRPLIVSSATAVPATVGAEIVFTLSSTADVTVTVVNVAGRPVGTVLQDHPSGPGLQRVLWNGQSASGTRAPNGRYLVRIQARSADGEQAQAITPLTLGR